VWEVEYTNEFGGWWNCLDPDDQDQVEAAVGRLQERGPGLGRPPVDTVKGSRNHNMKELRVQTARVLFAFDPRRAAILLIGGDKRDRWNQFYTEMIPIADDLCDQHLREIGVSDADTSV
jgi:hypothetical protein